MGKNLYREGNGGTEEPKGKIQKMSRENRKWLFTPDPAAGNLLTGKSQKNKMTSKTNSPGHALTESGQMT